MKKLTFREKDLVAALVASSTIIMIALSYEKDPVLGLAGAIAVVAWMLYSSFRI